MGAGRKTSTYDVDTRAGEVRSFEDLQRNLTQELGGCIFGCTDDTYEECVTGMVFGLPKAHWCYVQWVAAGIPIFLFNYKDRKLHGIFRSVSDGTLNINPTGWCRGAQTRTLYPAQVQVEWYRKCEPLKPHEYQPIIRNCYIAEQGGKFAFELRRNEAQELCRAFTRGQPIGAAPAAVPRPAAQPAAQAAAGAAASLREAKGSTGDAARGSMADRVKGAHAGSAPAPDTGELPALGTADFPALGAPAKGMAWSKAKVHPESYSAAAARRAAAAAPSAPAAAAAAPAAKGKGRAAAAGPAQAPKASSHAAGAAAAGAPAGPGAPSAAGAAQPAAATGPMADRRTNAGTGVGTKRRPDSERAAAAAAPAAAAPSGTLPSTQAARAGPRASVAAELRSAAAAGGAAAAAAAAKPAAVATGDAGPADGVEAPGTPTAKSGESKAWGAEDMKADDQATPAAASQPQPGVAGAAPVPSAEEVTASLTAAHAAVAAVDVGAADALWHVLTNVVALLDRARAERLGIARAVNRLQTENAAMKAELIALRRDTAAVGSAAGVAVEPVSATLTGTNGPLASGQEMWLLGGGTHGAWTSTMEVWAPQRRAAVTFQAAMPDARGYGGAAVIGRDVYNVGGGNGRNWYRSAHKYQIDTQEWFEMAPMGLVRGSPAAVALDGRLYVMGGGEVGVHLASTEVLDPQQNVWLSGPALSSRRFATAAAALNGAILIAGGYDGSQYLASAEMLDPRVGEWKPVAAMNTKRGSQAMTAVDGQIMAVGGWDSSEFLKSVEAFDARKGVWRPVAPMAAGRAYGAAAALDGVVYALGGMRGPEHNELVERYDVGADAWSVVELAPGAEPFKRAFMSSCVL